MPESFQVTCVICVGHYINPTSGLEMWPVEIRRDDAITQLGAYESEAIANARAKAVARKLSALLDAAQELLA